MIEINSLWIGTLSNLEVLAINSHLKNGHRFVLWHYDHVDAPAGTILKNAEEILSRESVFSYQKGPGKGSVSAFSNIFRYKLLVERGGWWADTDVVCLRPFEFEVPYVFASERQEQHMGLPIPTSCVIKTPANSDALKWCLERALEKDKTKLVWGEIGPRMLSKSITIHDLEDYVQSPETFCPIDWFDCVTLLGSPTQIPYILPKESESWGYGIHLWNEMWRRRDIDKNKVFNPDCLFEHLKSMYL